MSLPALKAAFGSINYKIYGGKMKARRVVICCLLLLLALPGCSKHENKITQKPPAQKTIMNVPPAQMPEALADSYRLRPDRRFLLAVADIHHFFSGQKKGSASVVFRNGHWDISYGNEKVGAVPELPDFRDFISVLSDWSRKLDKEYPLRFSSVTADTATSGINNELSHFMAPEAMAAARQVDDLWNKGRRDPGLLYAGTRALVDLTVQDMDDLEIGDALPAHALASLALTTTLTGNKCIRQAALLAYTMGYSTYAASMAKTLPPSDPVGAYVTQDEQHLEQAAEAPGSGAESHYLLLLSLSAKRDVKSFYSRADAYFPNQYISLPVFKAAMEMNGFSTITELSEAMPSLLIITMARDAGLLPNMPAYQKEAGTGSGKNLQSRYVSVYEEVQSGLPEVIGSFDSGLQKMGMNYKGPFLDPQTYDAYYKSYFFSSLYDLGLHYMDALSSQDAVNRFVSLLSKCNTGTASEFRTWYTNLAKSTEGRISLAALSSQINRKTSIGVVPFIRTFDEQKEYYGFGAPAMMKAVRDLVPHLDTRIKNRLYLGQMAYSDLLDLKLTEKLTLSVLRDAASQNMYSRLWYARMSGNISQLLDILHSGAAFKTKVQAMRFLEEQKDAHENTIEKEYRRLVKENPDDWSASWYYAHYLEKNRKYPEARRVLNDWLKRKVVTLGLEDISFRDYIARSYYDQGLYKQGWAEIKPVIASEKGGALRMATLLLDKLGHPQKAEKMGLFYVHRYPDYLPARLALTELYWRHGKYGKAADLLKSAVHHITAQGWSWYVSPKFAEVFKDKPGEAMSAFHALLASRFNPIALMSIPDKLSQDGDNRLAFRMSIQLKARGIEELVFLVRSYSYLKAFETNEDAAAWLRKIVPSRMVGPLSMISYDHSQYEILWDFNPVKGNGRDFFWLMRAAASLQSSVDAHRKELLDHYSGKGKGYYFTIGKFLMGLATKKDLLSMVNDPQKRCEVAYYIGLKEQAEGHYMDASDWYRISVETGLDHNGEYRWAYEALDNWYGRGKTLERIAAQSHSKGKAG